MKTESLENSIHILDYPDNEVEQSNNLIAELSDPKQDIENNFIEPFKKELDINVLNKESQDGIRIVLRHYINEFMRANVFFNKHKQILYHNRYIGEKSSEYSSPPSWDSIKCSEFDKYVITSYYIFNCHFYDIQECCIKNQIDFFDLCRVVHFRWDLLSTSITLRYWETEDYILRKNRIEEEAIVIDDKKYIKPFPEYLEHEKQDKLAEICNNVFNKGHSPKEYAIMFCLLSDKGFITVPNRKRNNYYMAWYIFIHKQFPKRNNFYAINKFIFDKAANGLFFNDESDPDYLQLKSTFDNILKTNKF